MDLSIFTEYNDNEKIVLDYIEMVNLKPNQNEFKNGECIRAVKRLVKELGVSGSPSLYYHCIKVITLRTHRRHRANFFKTIKNLFTPKLDIVYMLKNKGEVVYIGKSKSVTKRINTHCADKDFDESFICLCKNELEVDRLENHLIKKLEPKYNKALNLRLAKEFRDNPFEYEFYEPNNIPSPLIPCSFLHKTKNKNNTYLFDYPYLIYNFENLKPYWWKDK